MRVVIAGGGTAGHVYPGLALADAIVRARPGAAVTFVGTARGIETAAVPAAGFPLRLIEVVPWSKSLGLKRYLAPAALVPAVAASRAVLRADRPDIVVGMGGYASMPVVLAARWMRMPIVLHEQNAVPGLANLAGARMTRHIALSFEDARRAFPRHADIRVVGNPIRTSIASLDGASLRGEARNVFGLKPDVATVVLFGGSLGAATLNLVAAGIAHRWKDRDDVQVMVIAGRQHGEGVRAATDGTTAAVFDYVDRMDLVYAAADLVVARAGATTVFEIAAAGLPSILVPYPYARRDHQRANANALAARGGAFVVLDDEASAERVASLAESLLADPHRMLRMGRAARAFGKPDAAERLAGWVFELAAVQ